MLTLGRIDPQANVTIGRASPRTACGRLESAKRAGKTIPAGWAVERNGAPTTDPSAMIDGGAELPRGSTRDGGGHKCFFFSSRRRHTRFDCDGVQTCALPI